MRRGLLRKSLAVALVALLLLFPLWKIGAKIYERQSLRDQVVSELAATGVGGQKVMGPVLILPCEEEYFEEIIEASNRKRKEKRVRDCTIRLVPEDLSLRGTLKTELRNRGIYSARFYRAGLTAEGHFSLAQVAREAPPGVTRRWGDRILALAIQDMRGIKSKLLLNWNETRVAFAPGAELEMLGPGVHARLAGSASDWSATQRFSFHADLDGLEALEFAPSAKQMRVSLQAAWPHPSFFGRYLPDKPEVSERGFSATWRVSEFSSGAPRTLANCAADRCNTLAGETFGVRLVDPVNVYTQSSRAVTYGFLFVGLTFVIFLLFEMLKSLLIHPVQYGLVGAALAMFFLLLFSLSEHIAFGHAYLIAAGACVALIGVYVAFVLRSALRSGAFTAVLAGLYAALYVLLKSEDYALLLGAVLVFGVLAAVMLLTRKLDWYQLSERQQAAA